MPLRVVFFPCTTFSPVVGVNQPCRMGSEPVTLRLCQSPLLGGPVVALTKVPSGGVNSIHYKYGVLLEHHSQCKAFCSRKRLAILLTWLAHGHTFQKDDNDIMLGSSRLHAFSLRLLLKMFAPSGVHDSRGKAARDVAKCMSCPGFGPGIVYMVALFTACCHPYPGRHSCWPGPWWVQPGRMYKRAINHSAEVRASRLHVNKSCPCGVSLPGRAHQEE